MDNIFVWESYGDVAVYRADNVDQLKEIAGLILDVIESWGEPYDKISSNLKYAVSLEYTSNIYLKSAIERSLEFIGTGSDDSFGYCTYFTSFEN
jgi:hypothetical protein